MKFNMFPSACVVTSLLLMIGPPGCGGGSDSSRGGLEVGTAACSGTDTQEGLDCVLGGLQFSTVSLVKVPAFTTTNGSVEADAPSITSESSSAALDPSSSTQDVEFTWSDPAAGQTPAFCIQLCNHGVCSTYNMCSRGVKDGKKSGTFRSAATWTAVPTNERTVTNIDTRVRPIVSADGSDPIQFIASAGGYLIPGLNTVSTGVAEPLPPPNPPTKTVKAGAAKTVSNITFNFPPLTPPPTTPPAPPATGDVICSPSSQVSGCSGLKFCASSDLSTCYYTSSQGTVHCSSCKSVTALVGCAASMAKKCTP